MEMFYSYKMKTEIVNQTNNIEHKSWMKNTQPNFCFQKVGWRQLRNETGGVGIGLSTANKLASALGGKLYFETDKKLKIVRAVFFTKLTNKSVE